MKYTLDFNRMCVNVFIYFLTYKNGILNACIVANARMKFASEARLRSVFSVLVLQSRFVSHYLDTLWTLRV